MHTETIKRSKNLSVLKWIVLLALPILNWGCFWYVGFPHIYEKLLALTSSVILVLYFVYKVIKRREPRKTYARYIELFLILSFISIINASIFWGQAPWLTFSAGYGIYLYAYFFVLKKFQISQAQLVKIQVTFALIYTLLWLFAISQAPDVVFGNEEEIGDDRGFFRVAFQGLDFICLIYYYSITRYLSNLRSVKFLVLTLLSFFMMFATLSRMVIAAIFICTLLYVLLKKSLKIKIVAILILTVSFGSIMQNQIVNNLFELNERQTESGGDGIIRSEWEDSFRLFPFNVSTFLFGNGDSHVASNYGKLSEKWKEKYSYNRSDVGYTGFYVTYGIIPLLIILFVFFKIIKQKVPENYYYYKLYVFHFLFASITTNYFISWGASLMMVFYSLDQLNYKCRMLKKEHLCSTTS